MMDWKTLWTTFGLVFLAELGDKTQLATMSFAASGRKPLAVFAGSASALVLASLLAVYVGATLDNFIPRSYLRIGGGLFFIVAGVMMLVNRG